MVQLEHTGPARTPAPRTQRAATRSRRPLAHGRGFSAWRGGTRTAPADVEVLVRGHRDREETLLGRLHDGPLQLLIAASQDLDEHLAGDHADLVATVLALREAITELREINVERFDVLTGDAALEATVREAADRLQAHGGPSVSVTVAPGTSGPHDAFVAATVAELLVNVGKHASARRASVVMHRDDAGRVVVVVSDDGVGVTEAGRRLATATGHTGLRLLELRLGHLGGRFECTRARPGTRAAFILPPEGPAGAVGDLVAVTTDPGRRRAVVARARRRERSVPGPG